MILKDRRIGGTLLAPVEPSSGMLSRGAGTVADTRPEQLLSRIAEIVLEAHSIAKRIELWPGWNPRSRG